MVKQMIEVKPVTVMLSLFVLNYHPYLHKQMQPIVVEHCAIVRYGYWSIHLALSMSYMNYLVVSDNNAVVIVAVVDEDAAVDDDEA